MAKLPVDIGMISRIPFWKLVAFMIITEKEIP